MYPHNVNTHFLHRLTFSFQKNLELQIKSNFIFFFRFTADNDLNSRLKGGQQEENTEADQSLPSAGQEQIDQNVECDSNDVRTEAIPPVASPSPQEANVASTTGEVSSSYEPPVSTTSGVSSSVNYSDSDDADDCPVFEYSAESMQVAKESNDSPESTSRTADQVPVDDSMENDEDLVQLDDDEHFANETGISDEQANQTQPDNSQTIESPIASPETTTNTETECSENVVSNYAGDEQPPNSSISNLDNETEDVSETEAEAETEVEAEHIEPQPSTTSAFDAESVSNEKSTTPKAGIEGMDTEMISEDEMVHDDSQKEVHKADKEENNNRKSDRDDSFKKVSKSNKDRNYRDKKEKNDVKSKRKRSTSRRVSSSSERSRSRSRSRSRNRSDRRRNERSQRKNDREKRREIQRYDVRTLIADRQPRNYKDKYGRDNSRQRSLSPRRVVRSKSRSCSRSVSPGNLVLSSYEIDKMKSINEFNVSQVFRLGDVHCQDVDVRLHDAAALAVVDPFHVGAVQSPGLAADVQFRVAVERNRSLVHLCILLPVDHVHIHVDAAM